MVDKPSKILQVESVCEHGNPWCCVGMPDPAVAVPSLAGGCQMPCSVQSMPHSSQSNPLQGAHATTACTHSRPFITTVWMLRKSHPRFIIIPWRCSVTFPYDFMGRLLCEQVQAGDFTAKKEIAPLERRGAQDGAAILSFEFRKQLFEYDEASHSFSKLAFPVEVTLLSRGNMPALRPS